MHIRQVGWSAPTTWLDGSGCPLAKHRATENWIVTWSGVTAKPIKGLKFAFTEGLWVNGFASMEVTEAHGRASMQLGFDGTLPGHLVFTAMPHSGDKWHTLSITVAPVLP